MSGPIQNTNASSPTAVSGTGLPFFGTDVELMSADYIMWYVAQALGNIGSQLDDYKRQVDEKRAKADDIRKALAMVNDVAASGKKGRFDEAEYASLMALLRAYKEEDPAIQGAYEVLLRSYGWYDDPETGERFMDTQSSGADNDRCLAASEWNKVIDQLKQSLEGLNSDNELTMMKLQTLMQQRNQVSQFASNVLNALHEGSKAILSNLRV